MRVARSNGVPRKPSKPPKPFAIPQLRVEMTGGQTFHPVRGDVEGVIASITAYIKFHNLSAADIKVLEKVNRTPDFWRLNAYALETTFFVSLGRVFDKRNDAWTIQDLVENTIERPGFFSKAGLRERRRAQGVDGKDPDWLEESMSRAWEPRRNDLEVLRNELLPVSTIRHTSRYGTFTSHIAAGRLPKI
jgi:hypothetical protein